MRNGLKWVAAFAAAVIIEGTGAGSVQASGAEWEEWTGSNGVQYAGYRKDGVIHGMGEAVYANQSKYTGTFTDGRCEGTGECEWPSGESIPRESGTVLVFIYSQPMQMTTDSSREWGRGTKESM